MITDTVLVDVATKDLSGAALDWVVGVIEGATPLADGRLQWVVGGYEVDYTPGQVNNPYMLQHRGYGYCPSTEWRIGGPLIEKYRVDLHYPHGLPGRGWWAQAGTHSQDNPLTAMDATPLIAACRAIVAAKLGDIVKVPACLVLP
jgi:hypothetical protein